MSAKESFGGGTEMASERFAQYLQIVLRKKWFILAIVIAAGIHVSITEYKKPDVYGASTRILVEKVTKKKQSIPDEASEVISDWSYYTTQVQVMTSITVCEKTVKELDLKKHYGVKSTTHAAKILQSKSHASLIRGSRIIRLSIRDKDPRMAAKIANAMAAIYIDHAIRSQIYVPDELKKLLGEGEGGSSNPIELIKMLDDVEVMLTLPSVINDPNIKRLLQRKAEMEANKNALSQTYTDQHPQVKEIAGKLAYMESEILMQARRITQSIKASLSGQFNISNIRVLDRASIQHSPIGPNRGKAILKRILIALVLSSLLFVLIDLMDRTIKDDDELLSAIDTPLLGQVPDIKLKKGAKGAIAENLIQAADSAVVSDAFTSLRTALVFSMPQGFNKRIMVTSSIPGEGKTTVSYLIARTLAAQGVKVAYIELDLRKPALAKSVGVSTSNEKGMTDYLVGQAEFEEIVHKVEGEENIYVFNCGKPSANPTALFSSKNFATFLERCDEEFDKIIVDTPPSFAIPDGVIIASKMHGLVFVVGAGKAHRKVIQKTINKYKFINTMIFGAVLNRVNIKHSSYNYKYGYGYYNTGK